MNPRLLALKIYIPSFIKKKKLGQLFDLVADAFGKLPPPLKGLSYKERLKAFALFTSKETEKRIQGGQNLENIKKRLYKNAYLLGQGIRKDFGIRGPREVMEMSSILYQILGIDFEGDASGEVTIKKCFFSDYYSPQVCQIISSLDEGVAAGLSGGGKLSFSGRITEGKDCCRARLAMPEEKS
ncbi:MAG: L-2-amino-thiazoline-4-carboxylic acid hydrolase [Candidatus Aminicenantes bacterium]|nr:L-2-amino-thiazoline-4-carboxylic acid hydrolase [Candidatus Aminicenantes bacterium]